LQIKKSSIITTIPIDGSLPVTDQKTKQPLLEVKNLKTYFYTEDGVVKAVDGVDFHVYPGEVMGLVGESGCGKSVTSLSIMRLISPPGKIVSGDIIFEGKNLVLASEEEMIKVRGNRVSMIFQQPQTALNPVFRVGTQIAEVLSVHQSMSKEKGLEEPSNCSKWWAFLIRSGAPRPILMSSLVDRLNG
jgi:ABC-type dipeptide/oligopeptide/nickel transport system ATPase component